MEIGEFKKYFLEARNETGNIIDIELYNLGFNENEFRNLFEKLNPSHLYNDHILAIILNCLQLTRNEDFYSEYDLDYIGDIYKKLTEYKEYSSIEISVDYANFLYSMMDNNEEAKKIANEGLLRAEKIIVDLKELIKNIEEE